MQMSGPSLWSRRKDVELKSAEAFIRSFAEVKWIWVTFPSRDIYSMKWKRHAWSLRINCPNVDPRVSFDLLDENLAAELCTYMHSEGSRGPRCARRDMEHRSCSGPSLPAPVAPGECARNHEPGNQLVCFLWSLLFTHRY